MFANVYEIKIRCTHANGETATDFWYRPRKPAFLIRSTIQKLWVVCVMRLSSFRINLYWILWYMRLINYRNLVLFLESSLSLNFLWSFEELSGFPRSSFFVKKNPNHGNNKIDLSVTSPFPLRQVDEKDIFQVKILT